MTEHTYGHRGIHGSSRILLLCDGQTVSHITIPFNAFGRRKVAPTIEELAAIEAENKRRGDLLDQALGQWDVEGDIDSDLKSELEAVSPPR